MGKSGKVIKTGKGDKTAKKTKLRGLKGESLSVCARIVQIILAILLLLIFIAAIACVGFLGWGLGSGKFKEAYNKQINDTVSHLDQVLQDNKVSKAEQEEVKKEMKAELEKVFAYHHVEGVLYGLIAVFSLIMLITYLAFMGALFLNICLLATFATIMILLLIGQIAAVAYLVVNGEKLMADVMQPLPDAVTAEQVKEQPRRAVFVCGVMEEMQRKFNCCGIVKDKEDEFDECYKETVIITIAEKFAAERAESLKYFMNDVKHLLNERGTCRKPTAKANDQKKSNSKKDGCSTVLWQKMLDEIGTSVAIAAGVTGGFELFLIIMTIILTCSIKKE